VDEGTLRAHRIVSPVIVRHIVCVSHPKRPMSLATNALIDILTDDLRRVTTSIAAR
jgi:hypothetical protein